MRFTAEQSNNQTDAIDVANQHVNRNAWIITTENWFSRGKFIALPLNPEQVDFSIPLRVAHETTAGAKFVYVWRRRTSQNVTGSFTVSFNISSGNILPAFNLSTAERVQAALAYTGAGTQLIPPSVELAGDATRGQRVYRQPKGTDIKVAGLYDKIVPIGVQNLYALLGLVEDVNSYTTEHGKTSNRVIVGMSTLLFPQLLLYGSITPDGLTISMSAENPAEFTVGFSLLVQDSMPKLGYNSWIGLTNTYKHALFSQQQTIDWMRHIVNGAPIPTSATPSQADQTPIQRMEQALGSAIG